MYTILSDNDLAAASAFGIAFRVDDQMLNMLKEHNLDIEDASGKTHHLLPVPAVFAVDAGGTIQFSHANPDYTVRMSNAEVMEVVKQMTK